VGAVAPLATPAPPVRAQDSNGRQRLPLSALVAQARARWPGAQLARVLLPSTSRAALAVTLARVEHGDWDSSDEVTLWFDPSSGRLLRTDEASREPAGELLIRWLGVLHVGNFGGWPVKLLWSVGAFGLCALSLTGYLMWWNRVLRR
jgi:uncharacterized iron-regulated membrane protein